MTFAGKHVVITGASGGLGTSVVNQFLEAGATCHLPLAPGTDQGRMAWATHPRVVLAGDVDLTSEGATEAFYGKLPGLWASIHLAGGFSMAPCCETSLAAFEHLFTLNARTCFLSCREAVRSIRKTGQGGRIVNVAARPVLQPVPGMTAYAASKAAVAALTSSLAAELVGESIWVNAIAPSIIDTPANRKAMPDADHSTWPGPADLAECIFFLASPSNRTTSGALIPVYGRA